MSHMTKILNSFEAWWVVGKNVIKFVFLKISVNTKSKVFRETFLKVSKHTWEHSVSYDISPVMDWDVCVSVLPLCFEEKPENLPWKKTENN